ncbi:hypothetical protein [Ideonella sp.]|uniref:hypothetical protein n=1 Tax=Ideonella sp. TaxID=1929293 RepID=UPI0035AF320D
MRQRPVPDQARSSEPQSASLSASTSAVASAFSVSPRQLQQGRQLAQLRAPGAPGPAAGVVQRKGRVALDKIESPEKRKALEEEIAKAREARIAAKQQARQTWLGHPDGAKDDEYNAAMEKARGDYGKTLWSIKTRENLTAEQFPTGRDYYGTESGGVFKRPDNGKEYVEDANGTFMPRHVRRELNKFDLPKIEGGLGLTPTGHDVHGKKVRDGRSYGDNAKKGQPLNVADREFLQQSLGGGANQFAFSHTATHYPILSNDHLNFGVPGKNDTLADPHGRIVSDMSKVAKDDRRAQWKLAPEAEGGHKIRRTAGSFPDAWMGKRADKVITSGYRNMEVVTSTVPQASVAETQMGWEAADTSGKGLSPAGEWFRDVRRKKEKKKETEVAPEVKKEEKPGTDDLGA